MPLKVLSPSDVEQFIELGYVKLPQAFGHAEAMAVQEFLWAKLAERGVRKDDRATWTKPIVHVKEAYNGPVFKACETERLDNAIQDLVGEDRWRTRGEDANWGWWPVNFSVGADRLWDVPTDGWHWDGMHFRHTVDAPDQGLLLLCIFSEVAPRGGGTLVAEGSHRSVARFLKEQQGGIAYKKAMKAFPTWHPWFQDLTQAKVRTFWWGGRAGVRQPEPVSDRISRFMGSHPHIDVDGAPLRVVELTASPGDVFLCHPFLYHAASQNHAGRPRFMCNRHTPLTEPMQFNRPDGRYSPIELSVKRAIAA
jgi:hypothetical protein